MSKSNIDNPLQIILQTSKFKLADLNTSNKEVLTPVTSYFTTHCSDFSPFGFDTHVNDMEVSLSGMSFVELSVGFNSCI